MKQNLKMAILAANKDKPMPPVYYLLKRKFMESECAFAETHELPKELDEDDPRLLPCYATDVEATPHVQISSDNFSLPQISAPASNFGNIIKRKKADVSKLVNRLSTTCDSLSHLKAIRFGKENEDVAS